MHLPSLRIHQEMYSEDASLWFTLANGDTEEAILLKLPTTSLKAVMQGCSLDILLSRVNEHLCWCASISDVPEKSLTITGVIRHKEDYEALVRVLAKVSAPLFLYNEMDLCVAWSDVTMEPDTAAAARRLVDEKVLSETAPFDAAASAALDVFGEHLNQEAIDEERGAWNGVKMRVSASDWTTAKIAVAGVNDLKRIDVSSQDEGLALESLAWSALESVFPFALHHNPQVMEGVKGRELIDIVATHEYGSFLIESKDLAVLRAKPKRTHERRLATLRSHICKAIAQLNAAAKAVQKGTEVRAKNGAVIPLNRDHPLHCIVLVTEFIEDDSWVDVFVELCNAAIDRKCFFHVLDLRELVTMLKIAKGRSTHFDYMLMERAKVSVKNAALHVRSRVSTSSAD